MAVCWADVSYYQPAVNDSYPHPVLCIRSNDGTYRDPKFSQNYAWSKRRLAEGKLSALIVYCVYRPNWQQTTNVMIDMCGANPPAQLVAMIDVESWGGQITGNHSGNINRMYWTLVEWLKDERRVIGYGNRGDLNSLWPEKPPKVGLVVASYGSIPRYPGMIAHQYGSDIYCPPFGHCDGNAANEHTIETLLSTLGLRPRDKKVIHSMDRLPATPRPKDPNSDPSNETLWPQINWNYYFDPAGGWEGDCAISFGVQDWGGRTVDGTRGWLEIASWMMPNNAFEPVREGPDGGSTPYIANAGRPVPAHGILGPWVAPRGAIGITFNYSAPAEACIAVGRSA